MNSNLINLLILSLISISCCHPSANQSVELDCGNNQIMLNGECKCLEGFIGVQCQIPVQKLILEENNKVSFGQNDFIFAIWEINQDFIQNSILSGEYDLKINREDCAEENSHIRILWASEEDLYKLSNDEFDQQSFEYKCESFAFLRKSPEKTYMIVKVNNKPAVLTLNLSILRQKKFLRVLPASKVNGNLGDTEISKNKTTITTENPSVLELCMIALATMICTYGLIMLYYAIKNRCNRNRVQNLDAQANENAPIEAGDLKSYFPVKPFKEQVSEYNQTECTICLDEFKPEVHTRQNPICEHIFHDVCLESWLLKINKCPTCNTKFEVSVLHSKMNTTRPMRSVTLQPTRTPSSNLVRSLTSPEMDKSASPLVNKTIAENFAECVEAHTERLQDV